MLHLDKLSLLELDVVQVEEELQRAASKAHEVEEQQARLKVDQQRLQIQLGQAKEGKAG